jgi:hypothetical protein
VKASRGKSAHAARPSRHRLNAPPVVNAQDQLDKSLQHLLLDDEWDDVSADDNLFPDRDFRTVDE